MHVEAAEPRRIEDRLRQDQAIGHDHRGVGVDARRTPPARPRSSAMPASAPASPKRARLAFDRRRHAAPCPRRPPASARAYRPRRCRGPPGELEQRRHREIRRAHEDQPERHRADSSALLIARLAELRRLGEFLDHAVALELRDVIDEQHAVEMVDLVLEQVASRPVGLDLLRLAVEIEIAAPSPPPAARPPRNIPGSRGSLPRRSFFSLGVQTISGLMNTCGSFGSSFLARSMVTMRLRLADLDRGQPDAGRVIHGLEHVLDELAASPRRSWRPAWRRAAAACREG